MSIMARLRKLEEQILPLKNYEARMRILEEIVEARKGANRKDASNTPDLLLKLYYYGKNNG